MDRKYFNYSLCATCGGKCCTHCAGGYVPADFKEPITAAFIVSLLETGKFAIDWWEGDINGGDRGQTYFVRPRHVNERAIHGSWGGVCVNWSKEKGCALPESDRPYACRKLIPHVDMKNCDYLPEDKADKSDIVRSWCGLQDVLAEAIRLYQKEEIHAN